MQTIDILTITCVFAALPGIICLIIQFFYNMDADDDRLIFTILMYFMFGFGCGGLAIRYLSNGDIMEMAAGAFACGLFAAFLMRWIVKNVIKLGKLGETQIRMPVPGDSCIALCNFGLNRTGQVTMEDGTIFLAKSHEEIKLDDKCIVLEENGTYLYVGRKS